MNTSFDLVPVTFRGDGMAAFFFLTRRLAAFVYEMLHQE